MNWKETFYTGKREHPQEKKPASLTALLMPSLLGVAICLVCLCSLTWAWFTATQNSGVQPIQSATATVTASLNDTALGELPIEEGMTGTGTLTLHMDGSAQYAYVLIKVGGTEYRTGYLSATKDYTITVNESGATLTLCWGKQDSLPGAAVGDGGSIGTAQQEPSDTPDEQPATSNNSQQTPDTTVPANGDANDAGIDDANTDDQTTSNGENTGSENGGSTGNGSGEQGSDSGTGSDTGAGGSTGGDAGTGDTSNGTDGTTGE